MTIVQDLEQRIRRDSLLVQSPDLTRALLAEGRAQGLTEALRVIEEHKARHRRAKRGGHVP